MNNYGYYVFPNGNKYTKSKYTKEEAAFWNSTLTNCSNCVDGRELSNCENCYNCHESDNLYNCIDCWCCEYCTNCTNCDTQKGLKNKKDVSPFL